MTTPETKAELYTSAPEYFTPQALQIVLVAKGREYGLPLFYSWADHDARRGEAYDGVIGKRFKITIEEVTE